VFYYRDRNSPATFEGAGLDVYPITKGFGESVADTAISLLFWLASAIHAKAIQYLGWYVSTCMMQTDKLLIQYFMSTSLSSDCVIYCTKNERESRRQFSFCALPQLLYTCMISLVLINELFLSGGFQNISYSFETVKLTKLLESKFQDLCYCNVGAIRQYFALCSCYKPYYKKSLHSCMMCYRFLCKQRIIVKIRNNNLHVP